MSSCGKQKKGKKQNLISKTGNAYPSRAPDTTPVCKGFRGFQAHEAFVLFVFVLSFSLFQVCLVSLNYVGILYTLD